MNSDTPVLGTGYVERVVLQVECLAVHDTSVDGVQALGACPGAQLALRAGVLDELEIHQMPVLLGAGRRLFDDLKPDPIGLELTRVIDALGVTHLRYRVRH